MVHFSVCCDYLQCPPLHRKSLWGHICHCEHHNKSLWICRVTVNIIQGHYHGTWVIVKLTESHCEDHIDLLWRSQNHSDGSKYHVEVTQVIVSSQTIIVKTQSHCEGTPDTLRTHSVIVRAYRIIVKKHKTIVKDRWDFESPHTYCMRVCELLRKNTLIVKGTVWDHPWQIHHLPG